METMTSLKAKTKRLVEAANYLNGIMIGEVTAIQFEDGNGTRFNYQLDGGAWQFAHIEGKIEMEQEDQDEFERLWELANANRNNGHKAAEMMAHLMNYTHNNKDFIDKMSVEHRTLQESFTRLCLQWIHHISKPEYRTDLRNEGAKKAAVDIVKAMEFKREYSFEVFANLPLI